MLEKGGNAVDAVVAAAFASFIAEIGVVHLGGSGVAHLYNPKSGNSLVYDFFSNMPGLGQDRPESIDFGEVLIDFDATTQSFHLGRAAVAVPGNIAGLCQMAADYGRLPLATLLQPATPEIPQPVVSIDPAKVVQAWTLDDFAADLTASLDDRSLESGKRAYHTAGCAACHRKTGDPATAAAVLGPDLSGVGARFDPRAMLESIIHPSLIIAETYRNPAGPNVSLMPPGLINVLSRGQVLDLLAYLQSDASPSP